MHDFLSCLIRAEMLGMHFFVYRFDHHNCIVHDNPNRQHQCEKRDQVDRQTEHQHEEERSDQRNGDCKDRDQCAAKVPQKQIDNQ